MNASPQIFVGYRRDDGGHAGRLYDRLADAFSADAVFIDREDLTPGQPFRQELAEAIRKARVCLVVIGQHWLSDANRRRLYDDDDITRSEIRVALECVESVGDYALIPVLAGGAGMPAADHLPPDIARLPGDHAHTLEETRYAASVEALIDLLVKRYGLQRARGSGKVFHLIDQPLNDHYADPLGHLANLRRLLEERGNAAVLAAATVQGMGGVGKTQLALKYSHSYRDEYHGVWWFRAETPTLLDQDCAAFCEAQHVPVPQGIPHRQALRDWLTQQPRWLLVYDNVEDAAHLQAYLPQGGKHHALVTSRLPQWDATATLRLDVWSEEQALDFLRPRLPHASDDERRALARALGGLPLALEQACAYLDKTGVGIADYIADVANFADPDPLLDRADSPLCPRSIRATLLLAYKRLSGPAQALLHLCAWLAPEPIPEYLFTEKPELLPPSLAAIADKKRSWRETVGELSGYALCQTSVESAAGHGLLFHRLTLAAVQTQRWDQIAEDASQAVALLGVVFPKDTEHPDHWPRCAALAPHVLQFEAWHKREVTPDVGLLCWLLDRLADYLFSARGLRGEAERLQRRAYTIVREHYGEENLNTIVAMNNLAGTLQAQGDLAGARELQESVLAVFRRVLGEEHPDTLTAMNNLASTLRAQGDLAGARKLHEHELSICRRVLGEEHPDTLISMGNLANTLRAQRDLAGARKLHEHELSICRRVLGEEHPDTLTSMNNLAYTLRDQRDLAGARELLESALAAHRRVLGEVHPHTVASAWNLFATLLGLGDAATARNLLERHLLPLLKADPAKLSADLQTIRQQLLEAHISGHDTSPPSTPASPP